jgi:hypothetical protein
VVSLAVGIIRIEIHGDPQQVLAEAEIIAAYAATRPGATLSTIELTPGPFTSHNDQALPTKTMYRATIQMRRIAAAIQNIRASGEPVYGYPIKRATGLSSPTIYRNLKRLVELGWLVKIAEVDPGYGVVRIYYSVTEAGDIALCALENGDRPR